jgi:uracil-DNA glycosylase family 4
VNRGSEAGLERLRRRIVACVRCPRLRTYCRDVARVKRRAYRDWRYWGKPVPGFGDPTARVYILGLAPAAHGANRTGRMFTGDRSGDFLFAALWRAGFANRPESRHRDDGLELLDVYMGASVRCAPPANKPTPEETENCRRFMGDELLLLSRVKVVLALGRFAHDSYLKHLRITGISLRSTQYPFAHGAMHALPNGLVLVDTYHPSQQNTFTGKLKPEDLDRVLQKIRVTINT